MCQLYFNKTELKKETKLAKWSLLKETKPYLTWVPLNKYLLIILELVFRGRDFGEFGSTHSLKKQLLCPFWCCGWTTNKTKKAPVLVEFLLQEDLWGQGKQTEISTRELPGEGWRMPAGCLFSFGNTSHWLQNADPERKWCNKCFNQPCC